MSPLAQAAVIERDLRATKYPAMIAACRIEHTEAEAEAKAWAAIAYTLGAPCEPQGMTAKVPKGFNAAWSYPTFWFGGECFWTPWFETGCLLSDVPLADMDRAADQALKRRETELADKPGDQVKQARRDAVARIHAEIARRRGSVDALNQVLRARNKAAAV